MYSQTAGTHFEMFISYLIAALGLAHTEDSTKYQSKTPNPGMRLVFKFCFQSAMNPNFPKVGPH